MNKYKIKKALITMLANIFLLFASGTALAALYKWTDDDGQIHYSDRIPSKDAQKEHRLLNEQGVTVKDIDKIKTQEELQAEHLRQEQIEKRKELARKRVLHDKYLIETYKNKSEIAVIRDEQLATAEALIDNLQASLNELKNTHVSLTKRAANYERSGKEAPEELLKEIEASAIKIEKQSALINTKQDEKKSLQQKYDNDVIRFIELKNEIKNNQP